MLEERRNWLKHLIVRDVFTPKEKDPVLARQTEDSWLFDFRNILMRGDVLSSIAEIFHSQLAVKGKIQLGGLESAAISLVTGVLMYEQHRGVSLNGFFIRKSRKKSGRFRIIEGTLTEEPIVLLDDILNSGNSMQRQVEILEQEGKVVSDIFVILRYRDLSAYRKFTDKGIRLHSIFSLDDFSDVLPVSLLEEKKVPLPEQPFRHLWYFKSNDPNYFYVLPKSSPALDDERIYFGSDNGTFWALHQQDGSIAWRYKVRFGAKGKYIFSSPQVLRGVVYFGAYDGNIYALNAVSGAPVWINKDSDWVGSSPLLVSELGLLFIGLEFGLIKKRGGIAAFDLLTGEKRWEFVMPEHTHGSPAYSSKNKLVFVGSNDGVCYALNAVTGTLLWSYKTGGEIRAGITIDDRQKYIAFGSFDRFLYVINIRSGTLRAKYETDESIYSTPVFNGDIVYFGGLDKQIYAFNITNLQLLWKKSTGGRIFSSPKIFDKLLYIGSNDGRVYQLSLETGETQGLLQLTERITNPIVYNQKTERFFIPTFANEIYCVRREFNKSQESKF